MPDKTPYDPQPFYWNDADGDTGSIYADFSGDERLAVLEVQSRDRHQAEGVWLTKGDAERLAGWLIRFANAR